MCKKKDHKPFPYTEIDRSLLKNCPEFDIDMMYEKVLEELTLQQTKRDQLITIYLAAFAFVVPSLLTSQNINWLFNGWIFIVLGIIGLLFALIIIRYRKYKEIYWICCRTINVMMDIDKTEWKKENIQAVFYKCLCKKVKSYIGVRKKSGKKYFKTFGYVKDNVFSGETLYLIIHSIIAGCVFGLGIGIVVPLAENHKLIVGIVAGLILFLCSVTLYFLNLKEIYTVCVDEDDDSFNHAFKDAWFLHFFI